MNIDIVKSEPKTLLEAFERWSNNQVAQSIGLSIFSKTIDVEQYNENDWDYTIIDRYDGKKAVSVF